LRSTHVRHLLGSFTSTTSATTLSVSESESASASSNLLVCNVSQIATGLPYSESQRQPVRFGQILINIRWNLICFRPVHCFDLLGWGSCPHSTLQHHTLGGGPVLTVLFVARAHQPTLWIDLRVEGLPPSTHSINPLLSHSLVLVVVAAEFVVLVKLVVLVVLIVLVSQVALVVLLCSL
jgi:hypothetical protein